MELLSKGITLAISEDDGTTFKKLYGLSSVPDMGSAPEQIDVTNLEDSNRRYIDGIVDYGQLEFVFFYNADEEDAEEQILDTFNKLRVLQKAGATVKYRLLYPDSTGHEWDGKVNVWRNGAEVNAALQFTLSTSLLSEITDVTVGG